MHPVIPQRPVSYSNQQNTNNISYQPQIALNPSIPGGGIKRPTFRQPPPPPSEPAPPNQPRVPLGGFRLPIMGQPNNNVPRFGSSANTNKTTNTNSVQRKASNHSTSARESKGTTVSNPQQSIAEILKTPSAGVSGAKRNSLTNQKPTPGAGRPKPKPKPVVQYPKCTSLYDYDAKDIDELTLKEGDVLEIVKERK
jgi:hypothetical protein